MQMLQQLIPVFVVTLLIELIARQRAKRIQPPPPYAPVVANFDTWTERDKRRLIEQMREVQFIEPPPEPTRLLPARLAEDTFYVYHQFQNFSTPVDWADIGSLQQGAWIHAVEFIAAQLRVSNRLVSNESDKRNT